MRVMNSDDVCREENGHNNYIINILKMTITYLYAYTLLLIMMTFYPGMIGSRRNTNEQFYTPKRERGVTCEIRKFIQERLMKAYDRLINIEIDVRNRRRTNIRLKTQDKRQTRRGTTYNRIYSDTIVSAVIAMSAGHDRWQNRKQRKISFDSDAGSIGIDNRCSVCMSHKIDDFIGIPKESKRTIRGFGGTKVSNVMTGTIKWRWQDDDGGIHEFRIPNSYYVPDGGVRLMSPQHWAQSQRNQFGKNLRYGCNTQHDKMIL